MNPYSSQGQMDERSQLAQALALTQSPTAPPAPPHVYSIAAAAYSELVESHSNQTVIITGESGAGTVPCTGGPRPDARPRSLMTTPVRRSRLAPGKKTVGKTTMARYVVRFLTAASAKRRAEAPEATHPLEDRIVLSGPVMEGTVGRARAGA